MIIAHQKRSTNIVEYLLYLWQIEDLIRAYHFDKEKINHELVNAFEVDAEKKREIRDWYEELVDTMLLEGLEKTGHLQFLVSLIDDLNDFHFRLIDHPDQSDYQNAYTEAVYNISDFRKKMLTKDKINDMEVSLTVLYGFMLMRMKNRKISSDTQTAIESIRNLMILFSQKYLAFEEGQLEL